MYRSATILVLICALIAGCARVTESRFNPINWFGRGTSEPTSIEAQGNPLIPQRRASIFRASRDAAWPGTLIDEVSALTIERRPGGAVVRATGISDRQGAFDIRLVPNDDETAGGVLSYDFRRLQQAGRIGTPWSRSVTAAIWLTDNELLGVSTIRVLGARNVQVARR